MQGREAVESQIGPEGDMSNGKHKGSKSADLNVGAEGR
jgi:hypothetical protein